jgi:hypothetical protein
MRRLTLLLFLVVAAACHRERENLNAFSWSGDLAGGGTLRIRNTNGAVTVVPAANGKSVRVQAATHWRRGDPARDLTFAAIPEGSSVTVCAHWGTGTCSATEYTSHRKRGFLGLFAARGTDARVDFTVEVPAGTNVDVSTANGDLTVTAQSPVRARTANGGIRVATAIGPVTALTANGSVDVRMTTIGGPGDLRAETVNGSASLYVPSNVDGTVSMSTVNGALTSFFPLASAGTAKKHLEGVLGAGSRNIIVKTVNGSVTLGALDSLGKVVGSAAP